jgi:putative ABC transport system substrate-binding protein
MRRREVIAILGGGIVGWSLAAGAQQKTMPIVGFLTTTSLGPKSTIQRGLSETGYVEGQNYAAEYRAADGHYDRLPALANDLVSRKVDLIVTINGTPSALAAKSATSAIPIVFIGVGDPVGIGLVASLARPGGNVTGITNIVTELMPKLFELLFEVVPQVGVIALLVNPNNTNAERVIRYVQETARAKGVKLAVLKASTEGEIDAAFASLDQSQAGALVIDPDAFFISRQDQLVALASRHAVPAIYAYRPFVAAGGLISYGIDSATINRAAGIYAGRILKGEKPADLPVQQPTKFELVINLKTAKTLGLTVPQSLLARADEVIE